MQGLFSLFFDKKLYFYCFSALCKNDVYYKLIHSKKCIVKTGFIFLFASKKTDAPLWARRSFSLLFQVFAELISFFKGFGVGGRFAGAVQASNEQ